MSPRIPFIFTLSFMASLSGFLFGYDTGVVSGAMILLDKKFNLNCTWHSSIVSVTMATAAIFSLLGGTVNTKFGRRRTTIYSVLFFILGSGVLSLAWFKHLLILGRAILGMAIGLSSMTIPMYIAECAPADIRGKLVTLNNVSIVTGQFVAAFVDGMFAHDEENGWRYMFGLALIPAFIQLFGFICFIPESPRWLLTHGYENQAKEALKQIREDKYSEEEYQTIFNKVKNFEGKAGNFEKEAITVGCLLQVFQQCAGINTVMYYSATIMKLTGVSDGQAIWDAAKISLANLFAALIGVHLVERLGRRKLLLASMFGTIISLLIIARGMGKADPDVTGENGCLDHSLTLETSQNHTRNRRQEFMTTAQLEQMYNIAESDHRQPHPGSYTAFLGMVLYLFTFSPGFGPVPWTVNSEIYSEEYSRNIGNSLSTFSNWLFNFFISFLFLPISHNFGMSVPFYLYSFFTIIGLVLAYLFLPETRNVPLEEIQRLFSPNQRRVVANLWYLPRAIKRKIGLEGDGMSEYISMD